MKHTLVCFIFLTALQDGNTGLVKAQTLTHRAEEGGNITVKCSFYFSGSRKLFSSTTSTPNGTLRPFSASVFLSSASTPPTTQSLSSTSGSSTPSSASAPPKMETTQSLSSTSGSSTPSSASTETKDARSDVLIYVGLILVVMIVVLSAALLIFCMRRKTTKPRGPPVETEYADTQADRLYEEIRECDMPSRSPPVEVSSVYATAKDPRSDGVENIDLYSLATSPHNNADNLCYAEVEFSHIPATSSAPCGEATDVVYSVPQVDLSTASHTKDASPPVYSTVSSL
ncbi:hyphally regulated cell wall protein 3-like isoform X5 [Oreochromis aureus]|uniref:hyphally regulated cell wall protein 3-like isoform X5 n=1 Tax=Oreochromis aureus TaxID=47969 RepID=UPI0019542284|nr:hyphally regulated cell wall protein 3-like isoform X5 [Oreochromis aureus]